MGYVTIYPRGAIQGEHQVKYSSLNHRNDMEVIGACAVAIINSDIQVHPTFTSVHGQYMQQVSMEGILRESMSIKRL